MRGYFFDHCAVDLAVIVDQSVVYQNILKRLHTVVIVRALVVLQVESVVYLYRSMRHTLGHLPKLVSLLPKKQEDELFEVMILVTLETLTSPGGVH